LNFSFTYSFRPH